MKKYIEICLLVLILVIVIILFLFELLYGNKCRTEKPDNCEMCAYVDDRPEICKNVDNFLSGLFK